jgi:hypothetical protein
VKEKDLLKDRDIDVRITLKLMLKKRGVRAGLDSSGSDKGKTAGFCEYGNEHSGFIKGGECSD